MIRPFSINDAGRCRDIIKRCFENNVVLEEVAKQFVKERFCKEGYLEAKSKEYPFFVYENHSGVLAIGAVETSEIKKLYVDPNFQRRGIGTEMLAHLENAAAKSMHGMFLVYCFKNSFDFYNALGYIPAGERVFEREGVKIPTLRMEKYPNHVI